MAEKKLGALGDLDKELRLEVEEKATNWTNHPYVKNYHGQWREWIAWLEGYQYSFYNSRSGRIEDITRLIEDRKTFTVLNRILPMVRQVWGEMRYPHRFFVDPNTTEAEDVRAAALASILTEFLIGKTGFNGKVDMGKLWTLVTGICYTKAWWNKDLSGLVSSTKGAVEENGEVDFDIVSPFNVRPDPESEAAEDCRWFIEGKRVPKSALEAEFKLPKDTLGVAPRGGLDTGLFERTEEQSKEETVIRLEYYERKSGDRAKGRFMVIAWPSIYLLYDGDNPTPKGQIPYTQLPGVFPVLGRTGVYDSLVRIGQNSQRQLNRTASIMDESIKNYKLKGMIPFGSLSGEDRKAYTRDGVDYVEFNPLGSGTPFWQSPPPIPQMVMDWFTLHQNEIGEEMSIRKASIGQLPKYASRAPNSLFQSLKGQDEKVVTPVVEDIDTALAKSVSLMLQIAADHYSVERFIKVTGKNKRTYVTAIKGADLRGNTDVRVRSGIDIFTNKEMRQDIVMTFIEKGLIKDTDKAFEIMDNKFDVGEYLENEFVDERQAMRENDIMREGRVDVEVSIDDVHEVHFKIHDADRKKEDFASWPKKGQERLLAHTAKHKGYMAPPETTPTPSQTEMPAPAPAPAPMMAAPPPAAAPAPAAGPTMTPEEDMALLEALVAAGGGTGGMGGGTATPPLGV